MNKPKTLMVKLSELHLNTGQIKDVPKNPRFIKDERLEALKKSIQDDPEMLELRELVVYDNEGELVVIMGNMRFRAMKELGIKEAPTKILPADTPSKKLRAYIQKDNIAFGQNNWDLLGDEWNIEELQDFGLECSFLGEDNKQWEELPMVEDEQEAPSLEKRIVIKLSFPKDLENEIEEIKKKIANVLIDVLDYDMQ